MTHLRDVRLQRALEHAPDADVSPSALVRENIKKIARNQANTGAIASFDTPVPWWTRFWRASGQARGPWSAALATVLLGGIITLLWRDQEVPGAAPQSKAVQMPLPAGPLSAAKPEVKESTLPAPVSRMKAAAPSVRDEPPTANAAATAKAKRADAELPVVRQTQPPPGESSAMAVQTPAPAMTPNPVADAVAERKATNPLPATQSAAAGTASVMPPVASAPLAQGRAASNFNSATVPSAPAPALAAAPALAGAVGRARAGEIGTPPFLQDNWTEVDLQMPQRTKSWLKADAPTFTARALALVRADGIASSAAGVLVFDAPPLLRLRWWGNDRTIATLDLWADRYRVQRPGLPDLLGDARAADIAALVAQAAVAD